jgi:hypothetical protein
VCLADERGRDLRLRQLLGEPRPRHARHHRTGVVSSIYTTEQINLRVRELRFGETEYPPPLVIRIPTRKRAEKIVDNAF